MLVGLYVVNICMILEWLVNKGVLVSLLVDIKKIKCVDNDVIFVVGGNM